MVSQLNKYIEIVKDEPQVNKDLDLNSTNQNVMIQEVMMLP